MSTLALICLVFGLAMIGGFGAFLVWLHFQ